MFNENNYKDRIKARIETRNEIIRLRGRDLDLSETDFRAAILMISESLDDYIEHRIKADKILEEILKDIQGNTANLAETKIENLLTENMN